MIDPSCLHCREPVLEHEDHRGITDAGGHRRWQHFECAIRMVIGSVAHINRTCSCCCCFVPGADHTDPPGMTRRQAARAAWLAYVRTHPVP